MADLELPLEGVLILDFSQFLAGPVAAMRLADLGARVIKIERPVVGDIGRQLAFAGRRADGDTISFHAMNRNKEGITADLKDGSDLGRVRRLVERADVIIENFRPGVMQRIGLDYEQALELNPRLIYASATGYGEEGPWQDRPGQDLLAQSLSGLPWLSGSADDGPVPFGLSIADHLTSCHLAQGVTSLLFRRERTGRGGRVQTSLLEAMVDLQFELLSTKLNEDRGPGPIAVQRGGRHSGHAFLPAPYGTYPTRDGYLAIAMNPVDRLGKLLDIAEIAAYTDPQQWWDDQDRIEQLLAERLRTQSTDHWLTILDPADVWCAPVLTLDELVDHDGFGSIRMVQQIGRSREVTDDHDELTLQTTRSPIRVDGERLVSSRSAPKLGQHNASINSEFSLDRTHS